MDSIQGFSLLNLVLVISSYLLAYFVNKMTNSRSLLTISVILTVHHVVAYIYAYHLQFPANEVDPAMFLAKAEECIKFDYCGYLGFHLYVHYLARVYELGGSLYFVFLVNILFFVVSIYFFIGIADLLGIQGGRRTSLIIYGMWPSVIFFTTMHYREAFELYFLMAGVYFGIAGSQTNNYLKLFTGMLFLFVMGVVHIKGLLYLSLLLFAVLCVYKLPLAVKPVLARVLMLLIMCAGVYTAQNLYVEDLTKEIHQEVKVSSPLQSTGVGETIEKSVSKVSKDKRSETDLIDAFMKKVSGYRNRLLEQKAVRTAYISKINSENIVSFTGSYLLIYMEYLVSPFIFQVSTMNDLIAYAESLLRVVLIISSIVYLWRSPQVWPLFLMYLMITAMWAIGVVSYGAGIRHHAMTNWILALLGVPVMTEYIRTKLSNRQPGNASI